MHHTRILQPAHLQGDKVQSHPPASWYLRSRHFLRHLRAYESWQDCRNCHRGNTVLYRHHVSHNRVVH